MWNPFRRKALTASPEVLEAVASRQVNLYRRLGGTNQRVRAAFTRSQQAGYRALYNQSPAVRTVVDLIARNVSQLDLRLYEELSESERRARPEHAAAQSMRYPNPGTPADQFIRDFLTEYLIFHNAYVLKARAQPGDPLLFQVMPSDRIEIVGQKLFEADGYIYHRDDGSQLDLAPDAVIHWRGSNGTDPRIGISPLETLRNVIGEEYAVQAAIVELAQSGLTERGVVERPLEAPVWSNDARERAEEDLYNRLRQSSQAPVILEEGMKLTGLGVSPREAQMLEVRKYVLQQVASLYGVPLAMVGIGTGDIAEAQSVFYSDTLPPVCEALSRVLNLGVLVDEYGEEDYCFEFNLDEKQMGDDRLKALTSAAGVPPMTRNEARARLNLPPVKDGDEPITPANVLVGGKPSIGVMPIQDPNKPDQGGDTTETAPTPVPSNNGSSNGGGPSA